MANIRRHKSSFGNNKPKPMVSLTSAGVAMITMVVFAIIIGISASTAGDTPRLLGALAFASFVFAIITTFMSARQLKSKDDFGIRLGCFLVCVVAVLVWVSVYVIGMIN